MSSHFFSALGNTASEPPAVFLPLVFVAFATAIVFGAHWLVGSFSVRVKVPRSTNQSQKEQANETIVS